MDLNNPTKEVVLPEDVQKAVAAARNNVTVLENEAVRHRTIIGESKEELRNVLNKLEHANTQFVAKSDELVAINEEAEKAKETRDAHIIERDALAKEISQHTKTMADERATLDEEKRLFSQEREQFMENKAVHARAVSKFESDAKVHNERVNRIKQAINS